MCLLCTGKKWISVLVRRWSVFQNMVTYTVESLNIMDTSVPAFLAVIWIEVAQWIVLIKR